MLYICFYALFVVLLWQPIMLVYASMHCLLYCCGSKCEALARKCSIYYSLTHEPKQKVCHHNNIIAMQIMQSTILDQTQLIHKGV